MTVKFTTHPFRRSHGHQPRGHGRWAFQACSGVTGFADELSGEVLFVLGTLAEARRAAGRHFAALGVELVAVLP